MKRIIKLAILILAIVIFSIACGKDKDNTYDEIPEQYLSIEVEIIN